MGRIGDEFTSDPFLLLQALCDLVKGVRERGYLLRAGPRNASVVVAFCDAAGRAASVTSTVLRTGGSQLAEKSRGAVPSELVCEADSDGRAELPLGEVNRPVSVCVHGERSRRSRPGTSSSSRNSSDLPPLGTKAATTGFLSERRRRIRGGVLLRYMSPHCRSPASATSS